MRISDLLRLKNIPHERLLHPPTYSASRMAQALHVPGKEVAKMVLYRTDRGTIVAVLPATHLVDEGKLRQLLGAEQLERIGEEQMASLFPDFERGAIPPFGSLGGMATVVDESLAEDEEIVFEGQDHREAIRMKYRDFEELEHPNKGDFSCHV
jgi:Ala-tRNA(Pro) deacylase